MTTIATDRNGTEFTVGAMVNYGAPRNARVIAIYPRDAIGSDGKPAFKVQLDTYTDSFNAVNDWRSNRHLRVVA